MPIKYNLTKYDILAEKIHELSQKRDTPFSKDEELLRAKAILIASFDSAHSYQTNKIITSGNVIELLNSDYIKMEHADARSTKWRNVKNTDIEEVAHTNINGTFPLWLRSICADRETCEGYRYAWGMLQKEFAAECDGITLQRQQH
ncbi:MAG: hypothetical protein KGI06_00515 [Candidatus Micrarchaeota archaeon]|nr:hypothetical protein [Candidatus Micrarchaeota archaeon]